jgi:hypothetical protein
VTSDCDEPAPRLSLAPGPRRNRARQGVAGRIPAVVTRAGAAQGRQVGGHDRGKDRGAGRQRSRAAFHPSLLTAKPVFSRARIRHARIRPGLRVLRSPIANPFGTPITVTEDAPQTLEKGQRTVPRRTTLGCTSSQDHANSSDPKPISIGRSVDPVPNAVHGWVSGTSIAHCNNPVSRFALRIQRHTQGAWGIPVQAVTKERTLAYRDWEAHLSERHVDATRSDTPALHRAMRQNRLGAPIGCHRIAGRPSRRWSRSHASVGLRWLQHRLNALHLMAAMVRWGVPKPWALALARRWERASRAWLYTPKVK